MAPGSRTRKALASLITEVYKPTQFTLADCVQHDDSRKQLGAFYESLTLALVGGQLGVRRYREQQEDSHPDIVIEQQRTYYEVKSCSVDESLPLRDSQMENFRSLSRVQPDWTLRAMIVRHGVQNITRQSPGEQLLYNAASNVIYAVDTPFAVLKALHEDRSNLTLRTKCGSYEPYTDVKKSSMTMIALNTARALNALGMRNYKTKWYSPPPGITIAKQTVAPFPILRIDLA